jgi:hypothetical protein
MYWMVADHAEEMWGDHSSWLQAVTDALGACF